MGTNLGLVDSLSDRDRLNEVRGLAQHGAQFGSLAVVSMLLTSRGRSSIDLVVHDAGEVGNRAVAT